MRPLPTILLPLLIPLLIGCNGFTEIADTGAEKGDGTSHEDAKAEQGTNDSKPPAPDLGGKRAAGDCCAKHGDCVSNNCYQVGAGEPYCTRTCDPAADDCPVGFGCDPGLKLCAPPPSNSYHCSPMASLAGKQPLGGCCGKQADCISGECIVVAVDKGGFYFCTQTCTRLPHDDCPTGYLCSTADLCGTQGPSGCSFK